MTEAILTALFLAGCVIAPLCIARGVLDNIRREEGTWDDGYTMRREPHDEMGDI